MLQIYPALRELLHLALHILFPETPDESFVRTIDATTFYARVQKRHNDCVMKRPLVMSPFLYREPLVRAVIHAAKYRGDTRLCTMLGEVLWDLYGESLSSRTLLLNECWTVVPIPTSVRTLRERGYNQAEEIAKGFLGKADTSVFSTDATLLARHPRESQTRTFSKRERTANIRGSFYTPSPEIVREKSILLIDDVITTGATLKEAARALRSAGARRILCITVAH